MVELNSSKSVVILVAEIHKHKKRIKKNGTNGCVMHLVLVMISTRRERHLIVSFKKQREWKRRRGLKRPRGRRREHVLGKKSDKRSWRGKNLKTVIITAGRRTKKTANAVEVDLRVQAVAVVAAALDLTVLPQSAALEVVGQVHRIRHHHSLPRRIQATVAAKGGVDLVAHGGGEEEVTAPVAAVLAHLPFLPVLARGHVLIAEIVRGSLGGILVKADHLLRNKSGAKVLPLAHGHVLIVEIKSGSLGGILVKTGHLLRNKSGAKVLPLAHGHVLIAEIKSGSRGGILVKTGHLPRSESAEKALESHLPPCLSHQMGAEAEVRKIPNMKRIPREERATEIIHHLVVVHHEEADRTRAAVAAAEAVAEAGVKATTVAVNYQRADSN